MRISADRAETERSFAALLEQVAVLRPRVVPLILLVEPDLGVRQRVVDCLIELGRRWEGVRFAVEFGPLFGVPDVRAARTLIDQLGDERLGLLVDTWHIFHGRNPVKDFRSLTASELALVQLNDHRAGDQRPLSVAKNDRVLPGQGSFPLVTFWEHVRTIGYSGPVSVEVISTALRNLGPEKFADAAFRAAAELVGGYTEGSASWQIDRDEDAQPDRPGPSR